MENVRKLLNEANSLFRTSDHLMYVTYPLVKDNKLIIAITQKTCLNSQSLNTAAQ